MSSIHLQPLALESCRPSSLRERRRSSIRPRLFFPRLTSNHGADSHDHDNAIEDDPTPDHPIADASIEKTPLSISPLTSVHLSGYSTNIDAARHHDTLPRLSYTPESPSPSTSPATPVSSSKNSVIEISPVTPKSVPENLKWRLAAGYFMYFMCGWGDGITGAVIPYFEADFHLTSLTSSLLFTASTVGFSVATIFVENICRFLSRFDPSAPHRSAFPAIWNRRRTIAHSKTQGTRLAIAYFSVLHATFFVLMGTKGGYPILLLAYACAAFARGIVTAQLNLYFSQNHSPSIGYAYALWSFGGAISPLICQTIVAKGTPWPNFYWGSLVLSASNTCFLAYAFRPTLREFTADRDRALYTDMNSPSKTAPSSECSVPTQSVASGSLPQNTLRLALKLPYQWAVSAYAWLYCGCETTTQGFIVSYLLAVRAAKPTTVGYVTSGFWGGITVGRLIWGRYGSRLNFTQRKYVVLVLLGSFQLVIALALVMQLLTWFVNSNVGNAFFTAIIGMVFGPLFPACLGLAGDLLPPEVHMVSMGLISAFASLGASIFPFITGIIASMKGMHILSYVTVAQSATLVILWCLFPSRAPRKNVL
ncbi:hypothetical protein ONZ45_g14197 [Pleurotus djamor]|nr:hypothetical protein ONZ45_g14197 [Pleurotus djamor]